MVVANESGIGGLRVRTAEFLTFCGLVRQEAAVQSTLAGLEALSPASDAVFDPRQLSDGTACPYVSFANLNASNTEAWMLRLATASPIRNSRKRPSALRTTPCGRPASSAP